MDASEPTQDDDPYDGMRQPLARTLEVIKPVEPSDCGNLETIRRIGACGAVLWRVARQILAYWTPRRLEIEALRRADDGSGSSLVAEEAARLMDVYQAWLVGEHALEAHWLDPARPSYGTARDVRQNALLRDRIAETLAVIERRAMMVESRALDLRLRIEHEKLRAELRKEELTSALLDAMKAASRVAESEQHLRLAATKLDRIADIEKHLGSIQGEVEFVADRVMADFAERELTPPAAKAMAKLAELTASSTAKLALKYVVTKLFGSG